MSESGKELLVVGIGASAGGLEPLIAFFSKMPSDSGLAFVIIQHLSPDFKSLMGELLAPHTEMEILGATDGITVEPNTIYLIPVRTEMALINGRLHLKPITTEDLTAFFPINTFLTSLARENKNRAIGIILSGTGSDGTEGAKEISQNGGLMLVQDEQSAKFTGMPESVRLSGIQFISADPVEMPEKIVDFQTKPQPAPAQDAEAANLQSNTQIDQILKILREAFQIDFNHYKGETLHRRIERRMFLSGINQPAQYIEMLQSELSEIQNLYRDLLVDVTHFFRDQEAFDWLANELIPQIVSQTPEGEQIRIWSAACASGEEAYSLTILFLEEIAKQKKRVELRVFATDAHEESIQRASRGVYSKDAVRSISPQLLDKYFKIEGNSFRVEKTLRSHIVFAAQNLLSDSLFTNIDFISCRNMLIYLHHQSQKRLLSQFHFGLKSEGYLFLGPSEYLGDLEKEFKTLNRTWRIYQKNSNRKLLDLSFRTRGMLPLPDTQKNDLKRRPESVNAWQTPLFDAIAPDSVLVDEENNLIQIFGDGSAYLQFPAGPVVLDIGKLLHDSLVVPIRGALYQARSHNKTVQLDKVSYSGTSEGGKLDIQVKPIPFKQDNKSLIYFLIIFKPAAPYPFSVSAENEKVPASTMAYIEQLEGELSLLRESLQSTLEEVEATNEELQTANEELMSSNEELQSTNEELHSVNEELYTVNTEYMLKNQELGQLNNDMLNLQRSSGVLTIFLDKAQNVRSFTPAAEALFGFLAHDIGRSIFHLNSALSIGNNQLESAIEKAINQEQSKLELNLGRLDKILLLDIRPFLTELNELEGVVLHFTDITAIRQADREKAEQERLILGIGDVSPSVFALVVSGVRRFRYISASVSKLLGYSPDEVLTTTGLFAQIVHADEKRPFEQFLKNDEDEKYFEGRFQHKQGHFVWVLLSSINYQKSEDGKMVRLVTFTDITAVRQAEVERAEQEKLITQFTRLSQSVFLLLDTQTHGFLFLSEGIFNLIGYTVEEALSTHRIFKQIIHPDDLERFEQNNQNNYAGHAELEKNKYDYRFKHKAGHYISLLVFTSVYQRNNEGEVTQLLVTFTDVTELRQSLSAAEQKLQTIQDNISANDV